MIKLLFKKLFCEHTYEVSYLDFDKKWSYTVYKCKSCWEYKYIYD